MRSSRVGKFVLMSALLVAPLLLQSCSWSSGSRLTWSFTTIDMHGGDRFDWQLNHQQLELVAASAHASVVVTKLRPGNFLGLRQGDTFLRVANKPVLSVRQLLGDLKKAHGHDVVAQVERNGIKKTIKLQSSDYGPVLPPPLPPDATMAGGKRGASDSVSVDLQ